MRWPDLPKWPRLPALPEPVERFFARVQDLTARVIAFCQPIVVAVLLFLVYVFGVGLTRLVCAVFYRRVLRVDEAVEVDGSFWRDAQGYTPDPVRLRKQI
jgi:hypothetical protein